jgi:hypothetical protein
MKQEQPNQINPVLVQPNSNTEKYENKEIEKLEDEIKQLNEIETKINKVLVPKKKRRGRPRKKK